MDNNTIAQMPNGQPQAPQGAPEGGQATKAVDGKKDTSKRTKISKAQEYMFFAVLGAALVVGVTIVVAIFLIRYINFNGRVISAKDGAILAYSTAIKNSGACPKPKSADGIYTEDEIKNCDPNTTTAEMVEGSLRANVLLNMVGNVDLESVARPNVSICYNDTGELYTYSDLEERYQEASNTEQKEYYLGLIKMCSSLRVIPDALPSVNNENALMSSLGQLFRMSDWEPESLTPSTSYVNSSVPGVSAKSLSLAVEGDAETTRKVLANIEKSIRNFDITTANVEWGNGNLTLNAQATAYYTGQKTLTETTVKVDPEGGSKK